MRSRCRRWRRSVVVAAAFAADDEAKASDLKVWSVYSGFIGVVGWAAVLASVCCRSLASLDLFLKPRGRPRVGVCGGGVAAVRARFAWLRLLWSMLCWLMLLSLAGCDFEPLGRPRPRFAVVAVLMAT